MNALVPAVGDGAVALAAVPPMTAQLRRAVETVFPRLLPGTNDGDPGLRMAGRVPTQSERMEAGMVLARMDAAPRVDAQAMRAWMLMMVPDSRNAPTRDELPVKAASAAELCAKLPRAVLCKDTSIKARQTFAFFPAGADLYAFLAAECAEWLATEKALKAMVDAPAGRAPGEEERALPTEEERAAVRRAAQEAIAALQGASVTRCGP